MYGRRLRRNIAGAICHWHENSPLLSFPTLVIGNPLAFVFMNKKKKNPGSSIKNVEDDGRREAGSRLSVITVILTLCSVLTGFPAAQVLADEDHPEQTEDHQERIWDHELNRWLTPEELGHLEIYFSEDEAAQVMFPDSEKIRRETLTLTSDQKAFVEEVIGWEFPEYTFDVFIGETQGNVDGYALIQNTIGKHRPITYMVGVTATGECMNFEVMVYREARGNEIATKRFNYQYQGKTIGDPIRINRDIINITGATMSVRSASAGVKRVLVLVNEFYLKPRGLGRDVLAANKQEKGFFEVLFGL